MVNAVKGEVALQYDGATYRMRLDFNALAEFEAEAGVENALVALQGGMNARNTRALFWAGLRQCHPEITLAEAGHILTANMDRLGDALASAFPDATPGNGQQAG